MDWRDSVPRAQAHVPVTRNVLSPAPKSAFDIVPLGAYIELVPLSKKSNLLLEDMLLSMEKISTYIGTMDKDAFLKDARTVDAVVRNLEIIGEAASRIPDEFKGMHSEIPW